MYLSLKLLRRIVHERQLCVGTAFMTCILILILIYIKLSSESYDASCFQLPESLTKDKNILEDILVSKKKPTPGKTIFFHETSCSKFDTVHLTPRQACAVESAALTNPNFDVYVLYTAPVKIKNGTTSKVINAIHSYPNVNLRTLNLWTYAAETPIYDWFTDGKVFQSKYVKSHLSDFLRYLTLYKWGGTYLDLDVVILKSLENIKPNYAGAESDTHVAAGVLNFDNEDVGHEMAAACLRNFQINFNGDRWGDNGPGVITRVLKDICKTKSPQMMTRERCTGFKVFPIDAFYPIPWVSWTQFFDESYAESVLNKTQHSIAVHLWNRHSSTRFIDAGSKAAYAQIAQKFCPKVYKASGLYF